MSFRALKALFVLAFALCLPIASLAQEDSDASTADTPAADAPTKPKIGPFSIESVSGSLGATEAGAAAGAAVTATTEGDQEVVHLEMYMGHPVLRFEVNGVSRRLDVALFQRSWQAGDPEDPDTHELNIEIRVLQADGGFSVPVGGDLRAKLIIHPEIVASYSIGLADDFTGTAEIYVGVDGGVAADSDGASGVFGIRVGGRIEAEYSIDEENKLHAFFGLGTHTSFLDSLNASPQITGGLGWTHLIRDEDDLIRHSFTLDLAATTEAFDVERGMNLDDGRTTFVGLTGTYSFPGL